MASIFFRKALCSNKVFFNNQPIAFECQPSNTGCICLDEEKDKDLIAALDDMIQKRKGGVSKIDAQEYDDIKKNRNGRISAAFSPPGKLSVLKTPAPFGSKPKSAGVSPAVEPRRNPNQGDGNVGTPGSAPFSPARGKVLNDAERTGNK